MGLRANEYGNIALACWGIRQKFAEGLEASACCCQPLELADMIACFDSAVADRATGL